MAEIDFRFRAAQEIVRCQPADTGPENADTPAGQHVAWPVNSEIDAAHSDQNDDGCGTPHDKHPQAVHFDEPDGNRSKRKLGYRTNRRMGAREVRKLDSARCSGGSRT